MKNNNVVFQCRHRKNLLKLTLETRDTLANAQCRYNLSILAVAKSLRLIISRNSFLSSDLTSYPFLYSEPHETTDNHNIKTTSSKQTRAESNLEASTSSSSQPSKPTRLCPFSSRKDKRKRASSSRPSKPTCPWSSSRKDKRKQASSSSQPTKSTCPWSSSRKDKRKQASSSSSSSSSQPSISTRFSSSSSKDKGKKKLHPENDLKFETIHEAGEGEDADNDEVAQTQAQAKPMPEAPLDRDDVRGWDFFHSYDELKSERENDIPQSNDEDHLRRVRNEEGIPQLEKVEERDRNEANSNANEEDTSNSKTETDDQVDAGANDGEIENENGLITLNGGGTNQKDLLKALKEIEEHFLRAFESGLDVSKMLEVKKFHLQKGWERVIGGSSNFFSFKRTGRSISCRSYSCLSFSSPSRTLTSATWDEFRREPFHEDYVPMQSGSHAFTLSKLYAWEKILNQDVSIGEKCRKRFDRKCIKLRNEEAREGPFSGDKTRSKLRELHASIYVSVRGATSTSDKIIKVKDEELHPQIVELLQGLMSNCKVMCELHEAQSKVMFEVGSFDCPTYVGFSNKSPSHAAHPLKERIESWGACFSEYISAQKAYLDALSKWLSKCFDIKPGNAGNNDPPLLVMVKDWRTNLDKLPREEVTKCMKSLASDIRKVYVEQAKGQDKMRKVVRMTRNFDKKVEALKKLEDKVLGTQNSTKEAVQFKFDDKYDRLTERRNTLATYKIRLEKHKAKHISGVEKSHTLTLERMQTGFSSVFESLVNFSKASAQMYADLIAYNEKNANQTGGNNGNAAQEEPREEPQVY